jgi:hypothetical protein
MPAKAAVISVIRVCKRCGAKISTGATQEVCPACLLEADLGLFEDKSVAGVGDHGRENGVPLADGKKTARSGF